jgi:hypothetical protein
MVGWQLGKCISPRKITQENLNTKDMKTFEVTYEYGKFNIEVTAKVKVGSELGARLWAKNQGAKKILNVK